MNVTKKQICIQQKHENNYGPVSNLFWNQFYLPLLTFHNFQLLHLLLTSSAKNKFSALWQKSKSGNVRLR
jgi:hypothetical protein